LYEDTNEGIETHTNKKMKGNKMASRVRVIGGTYGFRNIKNDERFI